MLLALCGPAGAQTGTELLQYCTEFEREAHMVGTDQVWMPSKNTNVGYCFGFIRGIMVLYAVANNDKLGCLAPEVTPIQLVYVFNKYAREHPEQLHIKSGMLALIAINEAFPCKKSRGRLVCEMLRGSPIRFAISHTGPLWRLKLSKSSHQCNSDSGTGLTALSSFNSALKSTGRDWIGPSQSKWLSTSSQHQ
jgi:hypothetical protein